MAAPSPAISRAQRGTPLAEVFPDNHDKSGRAGRRNAASPSTTRTSARSRGAAPAPPATASGTPALTAAQREQVVASFVTLCEGLYTHLPLKRARYGLDPVQRLRLLGRRCAGMEEAAFHYEMAGILTDLRDAHTRYVGPAAMAGHIATLGFLVESFGAPPDQRYIVSKAPVDASLIGDEHFVAGAELRWWNGVPIDRAVDLHADLETGGRPDSRRARAVMSLTLRDLQFGPPPDERWVVIGYLDASGKERELRVDWRVVQPGQASTAVGLDGGDLTQAVDPAAEAVRQVKKLLFAPERWLDDQRAGAARGTRKRAKKAATGQWLATPFADNVGAKIIDTPSGGFGYLRLWSFSVIDVNSYVAEVVRLLSQLPAEGLIVDVRANPGGAVRAAERLLQLLTPRSITPTRFSFLATPLTRAMTGAPQNEARLAPWRPSLDDAVATGELYSSALPLTSLEEANDIGQVYGGPVVAGVDANTYSAGDLFAAGFVDNEIGLLISVGEATGAGGANVWMPHDVNNALLGTPYAVAPLPAGIRFGISVRRATRSGPAEGTAIEDVGVRGHRPYVMTKSDLVGDNADMLAFCGQVLAGRPRTGLQVELGTEGAVTVTTTELDRLDIFVEGRPHGSMDVADEAVSLELPTGWDRLQLDGYQADELRQRRRLTR